MTATTEERKWEVIEECNAITGKSRYLVVKGLIALTRRINRPERKSALYRSRRKAERVARRLNREDHIDANWENHEAHGGTHGLQKEER